MKKTIIIAAIAAAAALGLSACSATGVTTDKPKVEQPVATPAAEKPAPPAKGPEEGSREAPLPYGQEVTVYNTGTSDALWQITVAQPTDATAAIAAENQFNEAPAPGNIYLAIPVHAVWQGAEPVVPWTDWQNGLDIAFVTAAGTTSDEEFVVQPWPSIADIAELYQGGAADFTTIVEVPADAAGLVRITASGFDFFVGVQ